MKQIHGLQYEVALAPQVATDNTALASGIVDTQGSSHVEFVIQTGTLADADATFAVTLAHGNDSGLADTAAPATSEMVGTLAEAGFTFAADNSTRKIGYKCPKRYVRITVTPTGNSGNAPIAIVSVKYPLRQPQ